MSTRRGYSYGFLCFQHPGVLGAPALRGIDHQRPFAQRHPREPARNDGHVAAGQNEGAKIDVPRREANSKTPCNCIGRASESAWKSSRKIPDCRM